MFAIIRTGGKQYRVAEQDHIIVEKIPGEPGDTITIDDVLMIGEAGRAPLLAGSQLDGASVSAQVVEQRRNDKILVFKKKRRKNYRRTRGHRQHVTVLKVAQISPTGDDQAVESKTTGKTVPAPTAIEATASETAAPAPTNEATGGAKAPKAKPGKGEGEE